MRCNRVCAQETEQRVSSGRRSDAHRVCARSAGHGEEASKCQGRRRPPAVDGGPGIRPRRISVVPFPARRAREPPRLILSSRLSSSASSAQGRVETSHALRGRYKPTNAVFPKITTPRSYFQHPSSKRIDRACLPGGDLVTEDVWQRYNQYLEVCGALNQGFPFKWGAEGKREGKKMIRCVLVVEVQTRGFFNTRNQSSCC